MHGDFSTEPQKCPKYLKIPCFGHKHYALWMMVFTAKNIELNLDSTLVWGMSTSPYNAGFRAQGTSLFGLVPKVPRPANPEICHSGRRKKMESKHNKARYWWVRECVVTPNTQLHHIQTWVGIFHSSGRYAFSEFALFWWSKPPKIALFFTLLREGRN